MDHVTGSLEVISDLQLTENMQGLDRESNALFRHKEVLATILQGVVAEYAGYSREQVMDFIEGDSIRQPDVSPGRTNSVIEGKNTAFKELNEKVSYFDILFKAVNPKLSSESMQVYLHIGVEPQKNYRPGYRIEKRGIYYLAREISSQLAVVTQGTDFGKLEKCYSIWICRDNVPKEEQYTITMYHMVHENLVGNAKPDVDDYDLLNLVIIRLGTGEYAEENEVLQFLNLLMFPHREDFPEKIGKFIDWEKNEELKREVAAMTGLGESILMEGVEIGRKEGRLEGRKEGRSEGEGLLADLLEKLFSSGRATDVELAVRDEEARRRFYREYGMAE